MTDKIFPQQQYFSAEDCQTLYPPGAPYGWQDMADRLNALLASRLRGKVRAIPADRVLGEGMVALRRFAERCAQRDHQPDEHIGCAKCVACEAEDALRANQGGANE